MDNSAELIIKSHFTQLKDEVNNALSLQRKDSDDQLITLMKEVFHYLKKLEYSGKMDVEGMKVYESLATYLDSLNQDNLVMPEKLPMAKARQRKAGHRANKKTGS